MAAARIHRAYHPGPCEPGQRVRFSEDESRHLARVLRVRPGQDLAVFDGRGGEWAAVVEDVARSSVLARLLGRLPGRPDAEFPVTIFQALCRPERIEWMVQKGTEVGVAAVRLVGARRVDAGRKSSGKLERWNRIALEACKQSGRRTLPEVSELKDLPRRIPEGVRGWLLHGSEASQPISFCLAGPAPGALWIAVGPEGGFHPDEVRAFHAGGWQGVALGPRTLRAETAGIVAAAIALNAWGDLG